MIIYSGIREASLSDDGNSEKNTCIVKGANGNPIKSVSETIKGDSFDWGYIGEKPVNLARSILVDYFKENSSDTYFNQVVFRFCKEVVKNFDNNGWKIDDADLKNYLTRIVMEIYGDEIYEI